MLAQAGNIEPCWECWHKESVESANIRTVLSVPDYGITLGALLHCVHESRHPGLAQAIPARAYIFGRTKCEDQTSGD